MPEVLLLNLELMKAKKFKSTFSIIMIDIDFFKKVNNTFGHLVGNSVLVETVKLVSKRPHVFFLRETDHLGLHNNKIKGITHFL